MCIDFLVTAFQSWDGVEGRDVVLDLFSYVDMSQFDGLSAIKYTKCSLTFAELYKSRLQPLEAAIINGTDGADAQLVLLRFYTELLRRWTVTLLSPSSASLPASTTTVPLIDHVNTLAVTLLQTSPQLSTHDAILSFYERISILITLPTLQSHTRISVPPAALVYALYFTSSLSTLSRLCTILTIYKRAFETAQTKHTTPAYPREYVNKFNGFLMDICNCLWRSRAFNTADPNALGCLMPPNIIQALTAYINSLSRQLTLPMLFSLSHNSVLCLQSMKCLREIENLEVAKGGDIEARHAGPATQKSLLQLKRDRGVELQWAAYRLRMLEYLEENGVKGVGVLMRNTMKNLMETREGGLKA